MRSVPSVPAIVAVRVACASSVPRGCAIAPSAYVSVSAWVPSTPSAVRVPTACTAVGIPSAPYAQVNV